MSKPIYVYQNHLYGRLYCVDHPLLYEECYCEECGDSDFLISEIRCRKDIDYFIEENTNDYCYDCEKFFESDKYDQCPYCNSRNIDETGSYTNHKAILAVAKELKRYFKED